MVPPLMSPVPSKVRRLSAAPVPSARVPLLISVPASSTRPAPLTFTVPNSAVVSVPPSESVPPAARMVPVFENPPL